VAVNLTGVSHSSVVRGDVVVRHGQWLTTSIVDAELNVLASLDHDVSRRGAYAVYLGSGEFPAKVRVLGPDTLAPGSTGNIRIYLRKQLPLLPGDRFILRESGRDETVGGGQILDIDPQLPASRAAPDRSIERVVAERGWVRADRLERLVGEAVEATIDGWVVAPDALDSTRTAVLSRIEEAGALGLDVALLDERERAVLSLLDDVQVEAGRAKVGEPVDPLADHPYVAELEAAPFTPPGPEGHDRAEIRELVRRGTVVEQDGVLFAASALRKAALIVARALAERDGITVADARDLLDTSRKYVLPILNYFDQNGITRRRDDLRIAGPRLPEV
jgi:selenocysteine-specific elongation factor